MKNKKLFAILTLVCFLMTLMPVAAFAAGDVAASLSTVTVKDTAVEENEEAAFDLEFVSDEGNYMESVAANKLHIWASAKGSDKETDIAYNVNLQGVTGSEPLKADPEKAYTIKFAVAGEYDIHVSLYDAEAEKDLREFKSANRTIVVSSKDVAVKDVKVTVNAKTGDTDADKTITGLSANGIALKDQKLTFKGNTKDAADTYTALKKEAVSFKVNKPGLTVTPAADKTDYAGAVKVDLVATRAGLYTVTATIADKTAKFYVDVTGNAAVKIETAKQPEKVVPYVEKESNLDLADQTVSFKLKDIHNNVAADTKANVEFSLDAPEGFDKDSVKFTASDVANGEFTVTVDKADGKESAAFNKEGKYTLTATLRNGGDAAVASWEVKKVGEAAKIKLNVPEIVALNGSFVIDADYVDANGLKVDDVNITGNDPSFYLSGKAVKNVDGTKVTVKDDEKYIGQEIVVTVIDKENNFNATATVKIVEDDTTIVLKDKDLEVFSANEVKWNIGALEGYEANPDENFADSVVVNAYVLNQPAGANATVEAEDEDFDGFGTATITSEKAGNVTVMVVAKYVKKGTVKYYTGTKVYAVGGATVGDVVVMTIGTQTLVKNGEVTTMDATPIIKDNRTFVPLRALLKAFGADVVYDKDAKTVTATLEGNTVVMTIGSNAYTVNGAEKVMDVAPYIDGDRTMVPVRFVAEAFGISVTAVPDVTDGTTASVIFNK